MSRIFSKERKAYVVNYIKEHYAEMMGCEIAKALGVGTVTVSRYAREYGLKHNEDCLQRIRTVFRLNINRTHTPEAMEKALRRRKMTRRMEELRILGGQSQHTKMKFPVMPQRHYQVRWRLINKRCYLACEDDPFTLFYDEKTERLASRKKTRYTEEFFSKKYGFCFEQVQPTKDNEYESKGLF